MTRKPSKATLNRECSMALPIEKCGNSTRSDRENWRARMRIQVIPATLSSRGVQHTRFKYNTSESSGGNQMSFKRWGALACMFFLTCLAMAKVETQNVAAFARGQVASQNSSATEFITADELKAK